MPNGFYGSTDNPAALTTLREGVDGTRTLCLTSVRNEAQLGDATLADPFLEDSIAPLISRFATLVFTEEETLIEPLLQQLRWIAYEHGIDHVVLPLWPETRLAHRMSAIAVDLGLPHDFVLTQDESRWPCNGPFVGTNDIQVLFA